MKMWVEDVPEGLADQKMMDYTVGTGVTHVRGPAHNGETGKVGIYYDFKAGRPIGAGIPVPRPPVPGEIPQTVVSAAMLAERCGRLPVSEIHTDKDAADALGEIKKNAAAAGILMGWCEQLQDVIYGRKVSLERELQEFMGYLRACDGTTTKGLPNGCLYLTPHTVGQGYGFTYDHTPPEPEDLP